MKRILSLIAAGVLAAGAAPAQTGVVDQSVLQDNVGWNMGFFFDMQQDVRVGIDGTLEGFKIRIATQTIGLGQPVAVFVGPGPHLPTDVPAWSGTVFANSIGNWEWVFADCSSAGLIFSVGDVFTIRVGDGFVAVPGDLTGNSGWPTAFYAEPFYEDLNFQSLDPLSFETFVTITPPTLSAVVPSAACGKTVQAVDMSTFIPSNAVVL